MTKEELYESIEENTVRKINEVAKYDNSFNTIPLKTFSLVQKKDFK